MLAITHRVDRRDALKLLKSANVLIYPVCVGYRGIYSGKMFEYLASGNNILIAPGDNDVLDDLLKETRAGISKNSREEVTLQLQQWYDEWKLKSFFLKKLRIFWMSWMTRQDERYFLKSDPSLIDL